MKVPFFPYSDLYFEDQDAYQTIFNDVSSKGIYFAKNLKTSKIFYVTTGSDMLYWEMQTLWNRLNGRRLKRIWSYHFFSHNDSNRICNRCCRSNTIPIDCGNDHMIDVAKIESAITEKTSAIMPTQLMEEFVKWMQFLRSQINII